MTRLKNWTLTEYTNSQYTELAKAPGRIKSLIIANTGERNATIRVRLTEGSSIERAVLVAGLDINAGDAVTLDFAMNLGESDQLQVLSNVRGVHFTASGDRA